MSRHMLAKLERKDDVANLSRRPSDIEALQTISVASCIFNSRFAIALGFFLLIAVPSHFSRKLLLDRNDSWSRQAISGVEQFNHLTARPSIVFVGNSVMR